MSISTLRRQVKNVAYNFSDAQVKVREATSNDPWGPTTALMSEIADMTHNPISFTEIMSMVWKRLNDHGKNWRHVYKSLVLLDYLIKCGSEKVAQQCRENIYSIETLKDFQHIEENRDQGLNVRTKAKQMVTLLQDEERLKNERARFLLTRKRFIQNGAAISSDGTVRAMRRAAADTGVTDSEFEEARPASLGEEEIQLQIAMALSREECEKEQELRRGDDIRLQIALEESKRQMSTTTGPSSSGQLADISGQKQIPGSSLSQSVLEDLLSMGLGDAFNNQQPGPSTSSAAYSTPANDPWSPRPAGLASETTNGQIYPSLSDVGPNPALVSNDPWSPQSTTPPAMPESETQLTADVFAPVMGNSSLEAVPIAVAQDPWSAFETTAKTSTPPSEILLPSSPNEGLQQLGTTTNLHSSSVPIEGTNGGIGQQRSNVKTPENFLGENSSLVNLDNLMGPTSSQLTTKPATNPFLIGASSATPATVNPFAAQQRPSPSLNEMMQARSGSTTNGQSSHGQQQQQQRPATNPFSLLS